MDKNKYGHLLNAFPSENSDQTFEEWAITIAPQIQKIGAIVQARIPVGQSLYANHLEELFDITGEASALQEKATEFHTLKVIEMTADLKSQFPTGNPKTQLDTAKATPCHELTLLSRIKAMNDTIALKTTQVQSIIKYYSK